ncbi:hypothetical protein OESDEN_24493 [Oesophagostomum dentatum]|uniref:Fibrinogen C-terminal domain-containing protein n=1 Tax=Oesophagostomum dentatum TaxID=61180 RepID=A0A0B1RT93_OESDE|nr:hypothetical protein OESDEN_24493 [Oesophagostomum dentatum]
MSTDGGGWTLMSSDKDHGMADKTFKEYIDGFGNPLQQQVWLGLDLINGMTNYENQVFASISTDVHIMACLQKRRTALTTTSPFLELVKTMQLSFQGYFLVFFV